MNIGKILSDVVIENAAIENRDSELLYILKDMGMSTIPSPISILVFFALKTHNILCTKVNCITIYCVLLSQKDRFLILAKVLMSINQIITINKATSTSNSTAIAEAKATNTVSIEIQNIFDETEMLKEDIEQELKIKKVPEEEIELAKSDVEVFENALKEIKTANNNKQEPPEKSKNRLKRFWEDLSDEKSSLYNSLKLLRKGKDYGVKIAKAYNKIAENTGMPLVPPLALDAIKKL